MTAAPGTIHVDEDADATEIAEAITHLARYAARQQHHPDCARWVQAHQRIDALLDQLEAARA